MNRTFRLAVTLIVAAAFFALGLSDAVYDVASPPMLGWHTVLRKVESVVAFTVIGLVAAWWLGRRRNLTTLLVLGVAAYSALLEIGQRFTGSTEPLGMSLFDVLCGAIGGALAALIAALGRSRSDTRAVENLGKRRGK